MKEKSNKLISLLASLDRSQRRSCRKLIQSPFFSGNDDLTNLFDVLCKQLDRGGVLNKKKIWVAAFGRKRDFNDVRFRKYSSDLFKLIRRYIVQEALANEPELESYLYLTGLEKQKVDKLIRGLDRNWDSIAAFKPGYDHYPYLYRHLLEDRKFSIFNYLHDLSEQANFEAISEHLDVYFIVVKLRIALQAQTQSHNQRYTYDLRLIPDIIGYLDRTQHYIEHPVVGFHYYMYKMLTADDTHDAYFQYKSLVLKMPKVVQGTSGYEAIQPALNYCRRRINEGKKEFLTEYLEIYRFGLDRNLVFDDGKIDPLQFRNTILIALRHGDYEWTESYIENYQNRLPEKQRANAVNYNSATLYFYQKKYDDALGFLRDVEYENTTYNLNSKTMLLAIYYETGEGDVLDSLFDSTIAYLNRHKEIPEINRQAYRNLVLFTRRLTRLLPGDERGVEQLRADLAEQRYVASRPWLEDKIAEFAGDKATA